MRFKVMAEEMSDEEVTLVLKIIHPYVTVKQIIRNKKSNSIEVHYSFPDEPDHVPEEIHIGEGNELYQYRQFMIAKGYSEFWLDNPYVDD